MKVVQINTTFGYGSTGVIVKDISDTLTDQKIENYVLCSDAKEKNDRVIVFNNYTNIRINAVRSHLFGNYGFVAKKQTKNLIQYLKNISPDVIHIHNIHTHDVNFEMLFVYLASTNIKVVYTFHDCWAFTGYCPHFDVVGCKKYKTECNRCPLKKNFSLLFDKSNKLFNKKKQLLNSINNLTIVCPSNWIKEQVQMSFLKTKDIRVINNGIDIEFVKPTISNIRAAYSEKKIILGIEKENIEYYNALAEKISDDYQLIVLSRNYKTYHFEKENVTWLPYLSRETLMQYYTAADVFVNLTLQDTFPTVNIESLACGTPVVTFDTGGSKEIIDADTGICVKKGSIEEAINAIDDICNSGKTSLKCIERARRQYDKNEKCEAYLHLYKSLFQESRK